VHRLDNKFYGGCRRLPRGAWCDAWTKTTAACLALRRRAWSLIAWTP